MNYPVKSAHVPAIWRHKGEVRIIGGDKMIVLDHDISYADVHKFMIKDDTLLKKQIFTKKDTTWEVVGSKGDIYTVRCEEGHWTCECVGYGFRRRCKHIASKKEKIEGKQ